MADPQVLIVGAGPTGLVLALWLRRLGVRVRIVDKAAEPGTTSRALVVQARTLELYRQLGLADAVVERGLEFAAVNLWVRGRRTARVALGEMGKGLSPYPFMLIFPQDEHERLLIEQPRARPASTVERQTELVGFEERGERVAGAAPRPDGARGDLRGRLPRRLRRRPLHACARRSASASRAAPTRTSSTSPTSRASGPVMNGELHVALDDADFLAVFPLKGDGHARGSIGTVRARPTSAAASALPGTTSASACSSAWASTSSA